MDRVEAAILRTIIYAEIFQFPPTIEEIQHFLIHDDPVSLEQVRQILTESPRMKALLDCDHEYVIIKDRHDLLNLRRRRDRAVQHLWPRAVRYGAWLSRLPFVRMVAITGALAVRNPSDEHDDLDYLVITVPGRVWVARAFAIVLVRIGRLWGIEICPNYILALNQLAQKRRDIFMAREVVQMVPVYGLDVYERFRQANSWVQLQLPNSVGVFRPEAQYQPGWGWYLLKRCLETLLSGWPGDILERWEYRRKRRRFEAAMQDPNSSAQIDETQVKGHFNDHGHPVLQKFRARLQEYGLDEILVPASGD